MCSVQHFCGWIDKLFVIPDHFIRKTSVLTTTVLEHDHIIFDTALISLTIQNL
jgi:hypothetical protein